MQLRIAHIDSPRPTIARAGPKDSACLEAHLLRLTPHDAVDLLGTKADSCSVKHYLAGIDFDRDIVLAAWDGHGAAHASVRIRVQHGSRWAELLAVREREWIGAQHWRALISAGVTAAMDGSLGWLSVASLGYDRETREALEAAGFRLQAEEEGTLGELALGKASAADMSVERHPAADEVPTHS
jgi:hypothetical protein